MTGTPLRVIIEQEYLTARPGGLVREALAVDDHGNYWRVRIYRDGQWTRTPVSNEEARGRGYITSRP